MATISQGKCDTTVTMRSSDLIWEAEPSSMVAVYRRNRQWETCVCSNVWCVSTPLSGILTSLTNMMGKMVSLRNLVLLRVRKDTHVSHVSQTGQKHENTKVGRSSAEGHLREALDSLQDDIELSPLAGTNGNTSGLNKDWQQGNHEKVSLLVHFFVTSHVFVINWND